jgi:hypothetical protein
MRKWIALAFACWIGLANAALDGPGEASVGRQHSGNASQPHAPEASSHKAASDIAKPASAAGSSPVVKNIAKTGAANKKQDIDREEGPHVFGYLPGFLAENWDKVLASLFNGLLACFTAVLAVYTVRLWSSTKRLAEGAEQALATVERPYLFAHLTYPMISGMELPGDPTMVVPVVNYDFKNHGKLPAVCEAVSASIQWMPTVQPRDLLPSEEEPFGLVLSAGDKQSGPTCMGERMPWEDFHTRMSSEHVFFVVRVRYRGTFTKGHESMFCWKVTEPPSLRPWGGTERNYTR